MKKRKAIIIILIIIISYFGIRLTLNGISMIMYNNGIYNSNLIQPLYLFNFQQPYIVYYNNGNFKYKNNDFDLAIEDYKKSLNLNPPKSKVCDIRINLSLSTIYNIHSNDKDYTINQLELAKSYLYENECAHEFDDNGFSKDAEQLKNEINKLEDEIRNDNGSNNNQLDDSNPENNNEEKEDYSNIEQEILKNEKEANANRQDDLNTYENMGDYEYYPGKRW